MSSDWAGSALLWWQEAGVDTIVGETPRDWLSPTRQPVAPVAASPLQPQSESLPTDLEGFRHWLLTSELFPPGPRVAPAGDPASGLMILIDMPSLEGAAEGALLAGEVGAMFDRMLEKIGRSRETIYLASILPTRTATGRLPVGNSAALADSVRHHIGLVRPSALLLFGDECSKTLLGLPMMTARGRVHVLDTSAGPVRTIVTMSLRFLLNQPRRRKDAMADLELLMEELKP